MSLRTLRTLRTARLGRAGPVLAALAALAFAAAVSGCGSPGSTGTAPTGPSSSSTGPVVTPPHDFVMAQQVTVVRSGGIRGERTTWVFALHRSPPPGFTADDVTAVLKAAANPLLKNLRPTPPGSSCCDRYVFRLTVLLPDGTSRTYGAVEGNPEPAPLAHLLALIA